MPASRCTINIALFRHRETAEGVLLPVYLYSAQLPTYMKVLQYTDCREADPDKIQHACAGIVQCLD